jgi:hypothetical protein
MVAVNSINFEFYFDFDAKKIMEEELEGEEEKYHQRFEEFNKDLFVCLFRFARFYFYAKKDIESQIITQKIAIEKITFEKNAN